MQKGQRSQMLMMMNRVYFCQTTKNERTKYLNPIRKGLEDESLRGKQTLVVYIRRISNDDDVDDDNLICTFLDAL